MEMRITERRMRDVAATFFIAAFAWIAVDQCKASESSAEIAVLFSNEEGVYWREDRRFGKVLELGVNGTITASLGESLYGDSGSISFWVKPNWKPNSVQSHTMLSATWNDARKSYLAISEGWWEPIGAHRLYFVMSNEDIRHCSTERRLQPGVWVLLTATWSNDGSVCKLFIDDELLAETHGHPVKRGLSLKQIYIGTDAGASDRRSRVAEASIAQIRFFSAPNTHQQIIEQYTREETADVLFQKKWQWLENSPRLKPDVSNDVGRRAIFDEDIAWATSREAIDQRLDRIARAGFDIYVPCVWHGTGAWYPSKVGKADGRLLKSFSLGWDPLAYLIEQAHARGIAVHPWFTVVRRENDDHREWAENGVPHGAYDVHRPEFRKYIIDVMLDLVTRYEVDGVNLDYIRAMGVCQSQYCEQQYQHELDADLVDDVAKSASDPEARNRVQRWQEGAVEDIVRRFSSQAKRIKNDIVISVDGCAETDDSKRPLEGRNEIRWLNQGLIDGVFHMDYSSRPNQEKVIAARQVLNEPEKLWLLIANYDVIDTSPVPRSARWLNGMLRYAARTTPKATTGVYLLDRLSDDQIVGLAELNHRHSHSPAEKRD